MNTMVAVQSFLTNRRALNRSPKTISWYEHILCRFAAKCPELPMEPEPIEEFLARAAPKKEQDHLRHAYYRSIKALYRFVCRRKRLPDPVDLIGSPKVIKKVKQTLNAEQMFDVLNLADNLRDQALLSTFIDTGARASEIATLTKANVFEQKIKVDGKTGQREIPISDATRHLLLRLMSTDGKSGYVFLNHHGQPLTRSGIYLIVRGYIQKAGIQGPKLGPSRLRHAFGTNYIVNGGDTRSLQKIMGHASITTTEIYIELGMDKLIEMHHRHTPLRSVIAAAQVNMFDAKQAIKEAEEIVSKK